MIITIDGPSGSGKTTLSLMLAQKLNLFCLSSGYLYRGLVYVLKNYYGYDRNKIQNPDVRDVQAIFQSKNFVYQYQYGLTKVFWVDDITPFLKDPEISQLAALIAQHEGARSALRAYERSIIAGKNIVVEGRACGTVIYPDADLKIYLDASEQLRAYRLQQDQLKLGRTLTQAEALEQIQQRDLADKTRPVEPLARPKDALILDSTNHTSRELLEKIIYEMHRRKLMI